MRQPRTGAPDAQPVGGGVAAPPGQPRATPKKVGGIYCWWLSPATGEGEGRGGGSAQPQPTPAATKRHKAQRGRGGGRSHAATANGETRRRATTRGNAQPRRSAAPMKRRRRMKGGRLAGAEARTQYGASAATRRADGRRGERGGSVAARMCRCVSCPTWHPSLRKWTCAIHAKTPASPVQSLRGAFLKEVPTMG